jgi:putative membrane protein
VSGDSSAPAAGADPAIKTAEHDGAGPGRAETPWQRLSLRVVWIDLARLLISLIPALLGTVIFDQGTVPVWPLVTASAIGVLGALTDVKRWLTTRYRVTPQRVEMRTGWLVRAERFVPRDRIRSVDSSANLRQRLASIRVVQIGSGESAQSFKLDALSTKSAERLRHLLLPDQTTEPADPSQPAPGSHTGGPGPSPVGNEAQEVVIARLRWQWVAYNIINIWAAFVVVGPLFGAYWALRPFGVDLLEIARNLADWQAIGVGWTVAICVAVATPVGVVVLAASFVAENWRFELVRSGTQQKTALLTRRGLFTTKTVYRDDQRVRGLTFDAPLLWHWLGLTKTKIITTGLSQPGAADLASGILPRIRIAEARSVAGRVLLDGARPMEAPLSRHPRGALYRRLLLATYWPVIAAGMLAWLGGTGLIPHWVWLTAIALWPAALILAVAAYRSLGHALAGPYLVMRRGALTRSTSALRSQAVIGWKLQQSVFQRWGGRMTVGVATAAGARYYEAPDAGVDQALALVRGATPKLADAFIEAGPQPPGR